jgi:hypothetical protein
MKSWKEITQYTTAVASLTSGIVLTYFQYFDSGDITNGMLGYVAQTLIYAASIFGVTMYWNGKYSELKSIVVRNNGNTKMDSNPSKEAI